VSQLSTRKADVNVDVFGGSSTAREGRILYPALGAPELLKEGQPLELILVCRGKITEKDVRDCLLVSDWEGLTPHTPAKPFQIVLEQSACGARVEVECICDLRGVDDEATAEASAIDPQVIGVEKRGRNEALRIVEPLWGTRFGPAGLSIYVAQLYAAQGFCLMYRVRVFDHRLKSKPNEPSMHALHWVEPVLESTEIGLGASWQQAWQLYCDDPQVREYSGKSEAHHWGGNLDGPMLHPVAVFPSDKRFLNIGVLGDLHLSKRGDEIKAPGTIYREMFHEHLEELNGSDEVDVIFIAGDIIDYGRGMFTDIEEHGDSESYGLGVNWACTYEKLCGYYKKPVFMTTGNHDWRLHPYWPLSSFELFDWLDIEFYNTAHDMNLTRDEVVEQLTEDAKEAALSALLEGPSSILWYLMFINPWLDYGVRFGDKESSWYLFVMDWMQGEVIRLGAFGERLLPVKQAYTLVGPWPIGEPRLVFGVGDPPYDETIIQSLPGVKLSAPRQSLTPAQIELLRQWLKKAHQDESTHKTRIVGLHAPFFNPTPEVGYERLRDGQIWRDYELRLVDTEAIPPLIASLWDDAAKEDRPFFGPGGHLEPSKLGFATSLMERLLKDLAPPHLLEGAVVRGRFDALRLFVDGTAGNVGEKHRGVDLVISGHSHCAGVFQLETQEGDIKVVEKSRLDPKKHYGVDYTPVTVSPPTFFNCPSAATTNKLNQLGKTDSTRGMRFMHLGPPARSIIRLDPNTGQLTEIKVLPSEIKGSNEVKKVRRAVQDDMQDRLVLAEHELRSVTIGGNWSALRCDLVSHDLLPGLPFIYECHAPSSEQIAPKKDTFRRFLDTGTEEGLEFFLARVSAKGQIEYAFPPARKPMRVPVQLTPDEPEITVLYGALPLPEVSTLLAANAEGSLALITRYGGGDSSLQRVLRLELSDSVPHSSKWLTKFSTSLRPRNLSAGWSARAEALRRFLSTDEGQAFHKIYASRQITSGELPE